MTMKKHLYRAYLLILTLPVGWGRASGLRTHTGVLCGECRRGHEHRQREYLNWVGRAGATRGLSGRLLGTALCGLPQYLSA